MMLIKTIAWREWRAAVDTPLGYVVAIAFLLASGFFFGSTLFLSGQADMRGYFSTLPLLFMFFIPAMSMRMLSEELRSGTFELLATLPVRTLDIVLGKYLAILVQVSVLLIFTLLYPFTLSQLGNLDVGQVFCAYFAALLLGAAYASVCLFASSLTRNPVVAYVVGFGLLFAFFLIAQAAFQFSPATQMMIAMISPVQHYQSLLRGVIGLDHVVYLVVFASSFVAITVFQLERRRWS
ncbi:MAG: ABC transporter permease subunit [Mariprofundaceae bacterium]